MAFPWERFPWAQAMIAFTRALGAAHTGDIAGAETEIAKLQSLKEKLDQAKDDYWAKQVEVQRLAASGVLAHAKGNDKQAVELVRAAADLDASMDKHPATPAEVLPARELLADLLLELNDPAAALKEYSYRCSRSATASAAFSGLRAQPSRPATRRKPAPPTRSWSRSRAPAPTARNWPKPEPTWRTEPKPARRKSPHPFPPRSRKAGNSAGWDFDGKSPLRPSGGRGRGPGRDRGPSALDSIRGAWEGEVGGAANPSVGPPHLALARRPAGERREKRVLDEPISRGKVWRQLSPDSPARKRESKAVGPQRWLLDPRFRGGDEYTVVYTAFFLSQALIEMVNAVSATVFCPKRRCW